MTGGLRLTGMAREEVLREIVCHLILYRTSYPAIGRFAATHKDINKTNILENGNFA
jgi:hypothetical protein